MRLSRPAGRLLACFLASSAAAAAALGQSTALLWTEVAPAANEARAVDSPSEPPTAHLDRDALRALLDLLPPASAEGEGARTSVDFPLFGPLGEIFRVHAVPVLAPGLERLHPEIRTLAGTSLADPQRRARITVTSRGVDARVFTAGRIVVVTPTPGGAGLHRLAFESALAPRRLDAWESMPRNPAPPSLVAPEEAAKAPNGERTIDTLTTYRLAVATTSSFARALHETWGREASHEEILGVIATAVNTVDEVFERDLGIRLQLVPQSDSLIFSDPRDEPFVAATGDALLLESQAVLDCVVGNDGYDVGQTWNGDGWSLAQSAVVGREGWKGQGATGGVAPGTPLFDLVYFGHELGHQFGAGHTYTGLLGECAHDFEPDSAVEPGSGSTLMSYASLCADDDIPTSAANGQSDAYFHARSIEQIVDYRDALAACQPQPDVRHPAPSIEAGPDVKIPRGTDFRLRPEQQAKGDQVLYSWEQVNQAREQARLGTACCAGTYRSEAPSPIADPLKSGFESPCGETCPLLFAFTARDGHVPGGGVSIDHKEVLVLNTIGPFAVDEPQAGDHLTGTLEVRWREAGTKSVLGVDEVDLLLLCGDSTLAELRVDNDGQESWTLPDSLSCDEASVKVAAVGNIFIARSGSFRLDPKTPAPTP